MGFQQLTKQWALALIAGAGAIVFSTTSADAAAVAVVPANCVSVLNSNGCEFTGNINGNTNLTDAASYLHAQSAYNDYVAGNPAAGPDIALRYLGDTGATFPGTYTGANGLSGTWSLPGYTVDFLAVKAGNNFVLYELTPGASSGAWSTAQLGNKNLSHLAFFGMANPAAVPEPASWALMLLGFGMAGSIMRKRSKVFGNDLQPKAA